MYCIHLGNIIFKNISEQDQVVGLTKDDINIFKQLDTSFDFKKSTKFFKRTFSQIAKRKLFLANHKLFNVTSKLKKKDGI
ncbi:unnamed protein product [Paramecium pentaurelia]|uniref:Uncharacterized protein n=1 Tax=Paramecium pentaurelia TaxID=43138 RepID=A0A8S1VJN6_9CILI|nr:unnamed protein product [Paramecium pentaurelia]